MDNKIIQSQLELLNVEFANVWNGMDHIKPFEGLKILAKVNKVGYAYIVFSQISTMSIQRSRMETNLAWRI
jgi:hypothetical protein